MTSDEAHFELHVCVNKHNSSAANPNELPVCVNKHNSSAANPNELHVKPLHSQRSGILAFGVIGPYCYGDVTNNVVTVTSDRHVHMVYEFLLPELRRRDTDLATFWFQQDVPTTLTARQSMNTLSTVRTSHNLSLWRHFSARPFGRSVSLWFLIVGLLVKQSVSSTSGRIT
jgi:hypothetical protein